MIAPHSRRTFVVAVGEVRDATGWTTPEATGDQERALEELLARG